jgi:hypothetical protein
VSQRGHARHWLVPTVWALLITTLLGVALSTSSWAFVDVYNNFYNATAFSWSETIGNAFTGSLEYRPLLIISMKLAHQLVGLRAWAYQTLVLLQFAAILGALIYLFRPSTRPRAVAACIALACVAGLHSSRVLFMVAPLNAHSFGVVLLLAGVILAMSPRSRWSRSCCLNPVR